MADLGVCDHNKVRTPALRHQQDWGRASGSFSARGGMGVWGGAPPSGHGLSGVDMRDLAAGSVRQPSTRSCCVDGMHERCLWCIPLTAPGMKHTVGCTQLFSMFSSCWHSCFYPNRTPYPCSRGEGRLHLSAPETQGHGPRGEDANGLAG